MNDPVLDELVALYRQSAHELAPARVDARVLRAAGRTQLLPHARDAWPWLGLALAASATMWLMVFHATPIIEPPSLISSPTGSYMLHMSIMPPVSPVTADLLHEGGNRPAVITTQINEDTP